MPEAGGGGGIVDGGGGGLRNGSIGFEDQCTIRAFFYDGAKRIFEGVERNLFVVEEKKSFAGDFQYLVVEADAGRMPGDGQVERDAGFENKGGRG